MILSDLLKNLTVVEAKGDLSVNIDAICYDSRKCGQNSLFVAIPGIKTDGHSFIAQAICNKATAVVYERDVPLPAGVAAIKVADARRALGTLGKNFYGDPSTKLCLIGVTGTKGKTTITYLLESVFQAAGFKTGVLGTVNYRYGGKMMPSPNTTPESIDMQRILRQMVDEGVTHVVSEVSSHAIDLKRVDDCDFDAAVFTNLAQDHLDYHETMEKYYLAKKRFFTEVIKGSGKKRKHNIVNADDAAGGRLVSEITAASLTYGVEKPSDVRAYKVALTVGGISAELTSPWGNIAVSSALIGKFNLYNILAAVATALALGVDRRSIERGVSKLKTVPGRLEKVESSVDSAPVIFVDYAHTEDALRKVLETLSGFKKRRIITVFGCGGDRDRGKRPLMGAAVAEWSDIAIVTSDNPRTEDPLAIIAAIEKGIDGPRLKRAEKLEKTTRRSYAVIPDRRAAIEEAITIAAPSDIVLIAGKGHEDYQIIGDKRLPFDDRLIAADAVRRHFTKGNT